MGKDRLKLPKEDYQQMLDRIKVICNVVENNLQQHPIAKINPQIKEHISASVDELHKAAQYIRENC
jgi:hypothetical protein|tara:strand:- start:37 stop:234 length:198 start_codon:yes stop_codon:yes gene_type:complete